MHILGRNRVFWHILHQNPSRATGCSELQEPAKKLTRFWCAKSRMRRNDTPGRIVTNVCTDVGVHGVIICADLYDCRLRGLGVAGGSNFGLLHWLALSPLQHLCTTMQVCDTNKSKHKLIVYQTEAKTSWSYLSRWIKFPNFRSIYCKYHYETEMNLLMANTTIEQNSTHSQHKHQAPISSSCCEWLTICSQTMNSENN